MLNAAIVGLGSWGRHLVESVQGSSEKLRFVAAYTPEAEAVAEFCRGQKIQLTSDLETLLDFADVQAVVIATPHSLHRAHVEAVAKRGKHVFVEKPLALDGREASRAATACARSGVGLTVGYNWRFQPAVRQLREAVESGVLGKLLHLEGNYSGPSAYKRVAGSWRTERSENPAGGMTGRGLHVLDVMNALSGPVASVFAYNDRRAADHDLEDTTSALFRFANGATGYIGACQITAEYWRVHAFGTRGWAEMRGETELTLSPVDGPQTTTRHAPVSAERAELEAFADAVAENCFSQQAVQDAISGAATLEAIDRSARTGQQVSVEAGGVA
jgi:predicted dehydrogenase